MAKKETERGYASISICLLGPSTSGKTTFFAGIEQALINSVVRFGDLYIHLNPYSVNRGVVKSKDNEEIEETVTQQPINAQEQLQNIQNNNAPKGSAFATGGSSSTIFNNTSNSSGSAFEQKDDRQVNNINIASGLSAVLKLNAELDKQVGISNGEWLGGTATTRYLTLSFEVKINQKTKCILQITDYAGELIQLNKAVPESMLDLLVRHLENSEAAIVLANSRVMSSVITNPTAKNPSMFLVENAKRELSANRINSLMRNIKSEAFTFLLALTQTDSPQVDERIKQNNYKTVSNNLKEYVYDLAFLKVQDESKWSTGIIPVSAIGTKRDGSLNVDSENAILKDAELNQVGIDKAILYCLYNAVLQKLEKINQDLKEMGLALFGEKRELRNDLKQQMADLLDVKELLANNLDYFDDICEKKIALQKVTHLV